MVVILIPTTSAGVMPRRLQAVPISSALVSLSSSASTISRTRPSSTAKRSTTCGSSAKITGESDGGGGGKPALEVAVCP